MCYDEKAPQGGAFSFGRMEFIRKNLTAILWSLPLAVLAGSLTAFFLWSLDLATRLRFEHPGLILLLPPAGVAMAAAYRYLGGRSALGNNLIIDEIHEPGGGVPLRMTPLILASTVMTHLVGGSAGREGTAVQMGGSLAGGLARRLGLGPELTRSLLMAGVAAGFGAVFGTPLAGAVFAMEVLSLRRIEYREALPCLAAAYAGHLSCLAWGIRHTDYHLGVFAGTGLDAPGALLIAKVALAAIAFGLCGRFFALLSHGAAFALERAFPQYWAKALAGGTAVVLLCYAIGSTDYLGLGVSNPSGVSILSSFESGGATPWSWLWKTLFTVITLSSGFKGGEVTPLFFIGASLGNALAAALGAPASLFAGLGFVAVFAAATKTPLACTVMGFELFGASFLPLLALACFAARAASGTQGIYRSQRP